MSKRRITYIAIVEFIMLSIVNESADITDKPRNLSDEIIEF